MEILVQYFMIEIEIQQWVQIIKSHTAEVFTIIVVYR